MSELMPGALFAGYRIEAPVARGGMGVVYRAIDSRLARAVALKVIAPHLLQDAVARRRFLHESRAAAAIEHPNVIPIHAAGEEGDTAFIVMRYVDGFDLQQLLRHEGALEPARAARIVAQVAAGLDAAHEHGQVHRDVKPANILLDHHDHAYLTDFGLAQAMRTTTGATRSGEWVGTADYVAPEQIRGERVDARADVYSLACVLFHALTGEVPFARDRQEATLWAHLTESPPSAREREPRVSAALDEVARRGMAKRRDERFPSAGNLGSAALAAASGRRWDRARERFVGTGAAAGETAVTQVSRLPVRRRRGVVAAAAIAAVVLAAGAVAVLALRPSTPATNASRPPAPTPAATRTAVASGAPKLRARSIRLGLAPSAVVVGRGAVWVLEQRQGGRPARLVRVAHGGANRRWVSALPHGGRDLELAGGALYAAFDKPSQVVRLDARTGVRRAASAVFPGLARRLAVGAGGVWVIDRAPLGGPDELLELDAQDLHTIHSTPLPRGGWDVETGAGSVWVASGTAQALYRVDPATGAIAQTIALPSQPYQLAIGGGALWAASLDDTVTWLDLRTHQTVTIGVQGRPSGIAVHGHDVWVTAFADSELVHIDAATRRVVGPPIPIGLNPTFVAIGAGAVWATCPGDETLAEIRPEQ